MAKHTYILSLGSNTGNREALMTTATEWLHRNFSGVRTSSVYNTEAFFGNAPDYLNMVAQVESSLTAEELTLAAKEFEQQCGRCRTIPAHAQNVAMDVDVMACDGNILRPDENRRNYFTKGLSQLFSKISQN
jgi:2-amino-4-hydroxy-6-hydroxymethyldihydropteridine diphosphokinase